MLATGDARACSYACTVQRIHRCPETRFLKVRAGQVSSRLQGGVLLIGLEQRTSSAVLVSSEFSSQPRMRTEVLSYFMGAGLFAPITLSQAWRDLTCVDWLAAPCVGFDISDSHCCAAMFADHVCLRILYEDQSLGSKHQVSRMVRSILRPYVARLMDLYNKSVWRS